MLAPPKTVTTGPPASSRERVIYRLAFVTNDGWNIRGSRDRTLVAFPSAVFGELFKTKETP